VLIIDYTPVDFPTHLGATLTKPNSLRCNWADLVWAAITVGRQNLSHVIQPGVYSYFEIIYRTTILYANLQAASFQPGLWGAADTHLIQSSAYEDLDPSEKSAISYFLGLTTAKLFAEKLLGTPWLMHLDTYSQSLTSPPPRGRRPDLVGRDRQSKWIVIEAKGRSNGLDKRAVEVAKGQATALAQIAGQKPRLHVGLSSYFFSKDKILKAYIQDPSPADDSDNSFGLDIGPESFMKNYYGLLYEVLLSEYGGAIDTETHGNRTYRMKRINEADLSIGLDEQVFEIIQNSDMPVLRRLVDVLSDVSLPQDELDSQVAVGRDGIYVRLGPHWGDDRMYLPPAERTV
jgi:hypothetical protein